MADTKVIMVGGRRCGKSSILASMIHQMMNNGDLTTTYLRMTEIRKKGDTTSVPLEYKLNALKSFISKKMKNRLYLVDFHQDRNFNYYLIEGKIPDEKGGVCNGNIKIEFVDCPGESYEQDAFAYPEMIKHFQSADTFIIVVDTPYLMSSKSDSGIFCHVNRATQILSLFQNKLNLGNQKDNYKKVIFVPVKCEKWMNQINQVSNKLQEDEYYGPLINYLKRDEYSRFSISILPVLTAGTIEFAEFGQPLITTQTSEKCSPFRNQQYRFEDGSHRMLTTGNNAVENEDFTQHLPYYSWFKTTSDKYLPKNCDQLALHIWRFIIYKTKIDTEKNFFPNWLYGFPSISNLVKAVQGMQNGQLLKDSGDGILNIQLNEKL